MAPWYYNSFNGMPRNTHMVHMLLCFCCVLVPDSFTYRQVSNIRRTLVVNTIVDNSDVVGASPVGAAPTTSSLST